MTKRILICGSLSGRSGIDKIARAGFTPLPSRHLAPPILKECPLNLECRIHSQELLGSHYWTIGRVEAVHLDDRLADGSDQLIWRSLPELVRGGVDSGKGGN
jgi:flavin reductase (DIM6/NTAB) family NADH-FMN oxidoreductase RutF